MDLKVLITTHETTCNECKSDLGRHVETDYDQLLADGYDRQDARAQIAEDINQVLERWELSA